MILKNFVLPVAIACVVSGIPSARADGDKATAEALFSEGRRLMAAGNYAAACSKFSASQKLDQGLGTSLNLADCYEKSGRTASAWAEFRDAASTAHSAGSKEREQFARSHADALEKRLARLTLVAQHAPADLRILRDGAAVDRAALGTAVPLDPGRHVVEAEAPGKKKWSTFVEVRDGAQLTVQVPDLVNEAAGDLSGKTSASAPASDTASPGVGSGNVQRGVAVGAGVVGVAGLVVGTIFGRKASSTWDDAKQHCTAFPYGCGAEGVALGKDAGNAAMISNIAMIVGVAGLAGGAALWFTAPSGSEKSASSQPMRVGISGRGVLIEGAFQ